MPNKGRRVSMRIVHRHHFSSALKRMSAIVSLQNPGSSCSEYMVTVKGAPETLRPMVSVIWYGYCGQKVIVTVKIILDAQPVIVE